MINLDEKDQKRRREGEKKKRRWKVCPPSSLSPPTTPEKILLLRSRHCLSRKKIKIRRGSILFSVRGKDFLHLVRKTGENKVQEREGGGEKTYAAERKREWARGRAMIDGKLW